MERLFLASLGIIVASLISISSEAGVGNLGDLVRQGQAEQASTYRELKSQLEPDSEVETIRIFKAGAEPLTPIEVRIIPKSERKQIKIARSFKK